MDIKNLLIALSQNYKLEPHTVTLAKELIDNSVIDDYTKLLRYVLKSQKFDFLSKLSDAIEKCETPTFNEDNQIEDYCKKLVTKCRTISTTAYENKPKGYNFYKFTQIAKYDLFINGETKECAFNKKEIQLLDRVGGCYRWLNDYDSNDFLKDLISNTKILKLENKKLSIAHNPQNKNALQILKGK